MDSTYELYAMEGDEAEFWSQRPEIDESQAGVLKCWHLARGQTDPDKKCSMDVLKSSTENVYYEQDFAIEILQQLDMHYLNLRIEQMKRQTSNVR